MTVKELKQILENANDDMIVNVSLKLGYPQEANFVRIGVNHDRVEISYGY